MGSLWVNEQVSCHDGHFINSRIIGAQLCPLLPLRLSNCRKSHPSPSPADKGLNSSLALFGHLQLGSLTLRDCPNLRQSFPQLFRPWETDPPNLNQTMGRVQTERYHTAIHKQRRPFQSWGMQTARTKPAISANSGSLVSFLPFPKQQRLPPSTTPNTLANPKPQ